MARRRLAALGRAGTLIAAVLLVGLLVMGVSRAAFFDLTSNASNDFAAGTVVISDDDSGSAMFSVSDMTPGDSATECIKVTYDGSISPVDVVVYVSPGDLTGSGLDDYLDMTMERGISSGGGFGDCTGFGSNLVCSGTLDGFASLYTDFGNGALWTNATTGDYSVYRFTLTLQDDNAAQGLDAAVTFTWEAQSP